MARSKQEQSEATTALLLEVGRELFSARGYTRVGLEEVAAAAGVTRGALYHHFRSKRGLFEAVFVAVQQQVAARIEAAAAGAADPWGELVQGCLAFLEASADRAVQQIMLIDAPVVLGWAHWRQVDGEHSAQLLEEVLSRLERSGAIRAGTAAASASLLSGAMNEAALWIARSADPAADRARAQEVLELILRGIRT